MSTGTVAVVWLFAIAVSMLGGLVAVVCARLRALSTALRDMEADFIRAQSVAGVGSWRYDATRETRNWSPEIFRILGLSRTTLPSREAFVGAIHPDDRARWERDWAAAMRGQPYDVEIRMLEGETVRWVRAKADLQFDEAGVFLGGMGTLQDITDRRRLEEELRVSEARASGIVSISADAIVSIDEQQRITLFNEGACRIFGYDKDELVGESLDVLIPPRFRERHHRHIEDFAAGTQVARHMGDHSIPIFGLRKNGEEFAADASISRLEVGGQRTLTVSLRDISENKRIELEHRLLAELGEVLSTSLDYEVTLSNVASIIARELADFCIIYILDDHGAVSQIKAACREVGNTWICEYLARAGPTGWHSRIPAETLATGHSMLYPVVTPERMQSYAKDDEHLRALLGLDARSILVVPLVAHGSFLGAIALVSSRTSLTSRVSRVYDAKDLRFAEDVAHRAALSIDNARLYELAQDAIRSRDEVLGVVAHDLRNPLNSITLYAEMLAHAEPPVTAKAIVAIERATGRMNRLIEDLLDVTRIEGGALALDRKSCSVHQLVSEAVEAQRTIAAAAGLELQMELPAELPPVWADRDRVSQVLQNLIGNAIKFTEQGTVAIGVKPRDHDVLFWVSDTGRGIAPEDQHRVFDRFWQGRLHQRRGAGLGLPIAKGLVDAHGGRIWLESSPGHGTTFFFTLPREEPRSIMQHAR